MANVNQDPDRIAPDPDPRPQPRSSSLANPSQQEALELDINTATNYPRVDPPGKPPNKFSRLWHRHVSMGVPHVDCRDHLGNLPSPSAATLIDFG